MTDDDRTRSAVRAAHRRLARDDAHIDRCGQCGSWTWHRHCGACASDPDAETVARLLADVPVPS